MQPIQPAGVRITPPEPTIRPERDLIHRAQRAEQLESDAIRQSWLRAEARVVAGAEERDIETDGGEEWTPEPVALRDGETRDTMGHATRNAEQLASLAAEIRLEPGDRVAIDDGEDTARVVGVSELRAGEHPVKGASETVSQYNGCGADERVFLCRFKNASGYSEKEYPYPRSRLQLDVRVPEVNE